MELTTTKIINKDSRNYDDYLNCNYSQIDSYQIIKDFNLDETSIFCYAEKDDKECYSFCHACIEKDLDNTFISSLPLLKNIKYHKGINLNFILSNQHFLEGDYAACCFSDLMTHIKLATTDDIVKENNINLYDRYLNELKYQKYDYLWCSLENSNMFFENYIFKKEKLLPQKTIIENNIKTFIWVFNFSEILKKEDL